MENNTTTAIITPESLLKHWQGHRALTRRVIEAFPEQEFFEFSVGGMRPFSAIVAELLAIAGPGLKQIVTGEATALDEDASKYRSKADALAKWDETTEQLDTYWALLPSARFAESVTLFSEYTSQVIDQILYFIDNEVHHRGQGYAYLRALGIEPPYFWER